MTMFEDGKGADVAFLVQGERIMGHSQILAARSTVFEHHLNSGMKESITKELRSLIEFVLYTYIYICNMYMYIYVSTIEELEVYCS